MTEAPNPAETVGSGYDLIRQRLQQQATQLRTRLDTLNQRRLDIFGSTQMTVIGRTRVRTENNCIPRDILEIGNYLLFGYNVTLGLKPELSIADVLSVYTIEQTQEGLELTPVPIEKSFLANPQFMRDFQELYRYYKDAKITQLRNANGKKLAVFRIGRGAQDVKVFRWVLEKDGNINYLDNRGERDNIYPPPHDFQWITTNRDNYVMGKHPHISIQNKVFVETIGGDLTIKVENNTENGLGIYSEPVDDAHQTLGDAQIQYAIIGALVLLKIRPYKEEKWRYLIFNTLTQQVHRVDAMGQACVSLPEEHGLVFPGGYYLKNGELRLFESEKLEEMTYKRLIRSPNGEDVLYIFHHEQLGKLILYSYNLIRKEIQNPLICHGYSIFDDGRMVIFRAENDNPTRVHQMQIWQTPYMTEEFAAKMPTNPSFLAKIGNAELVKGISECYTIKRILDEQEPNRSLYEQLIATINHTLEAFHWLGHAEVENLLGLLKEILVNAELIIDEFEKVQALKKNANTALFAAETAQKTLLAQGEKAAQWQEVREFTNQLIALRKQRGHLITLREWRYIDLAKIDILEKAVIAQFDQLSHLTLQFLHNPQSLQIYHIELDNYLSQITQLNSSAGLPAIQTGLDTLNNNLDLLSDLLNQLPTSEPQIKTQILEGISEVYAKLNRTRTESTLKRKLLISQEGKSEFAAQFKLFSQSVTGGLALADTPEKADEQLARLMVQLQELETKFSEFDEFIQEINEKREEVYGSFETRKQDLIEERQRRSAHLMQAAERILQGIIRRASQINQVDEQNAYFASDAMILKFRELVEKLYALGDSVRAGDLEARLKNARAQSVRELRDKQEIYAEAGSLIQLGKHRFSVNTQGLDVTLLTREREGKSVMAVHLIGTDFFQNIDNKELNQMQAFWDQALISENADIYRGEFLAYQVALFNDKLNIHSDLTSIVRSFAAERYEEGYERGIHDHDAVLILEKFLNLQVNAGLLRFSPRCRTLAALFYATHIDKPARTIWENSAKSLYQLQTIFGQGWHNLANQLISELTKHLTHFCSEHSFLSKKPISHTEVSIQLTADELIQAAEYLLEILKQESPLFVVSAEALRCLDDFEKMLEERGKRRELEEALQNLSIYPLQQMTLAQAWLQGFLSTTTDISQHLIVEMAGILLTRKILSFSSNAAQTIVEISQLLGQHPKIKNRTLYLQLDEFLSRLQQYVTVKIPQFRTYRQLRQQILEQEKRRLRLEEFKPKPLSSFVRNRLINEVYFNFIGDNLAKQMGSAGEQKRTDLMGLLLLISPPGYGKTTLLEYVAQRLGLIFVKINCPTLGHTITSLDPQAALNITARQELEKINLAFEMGNNVMLYLDDIQHSNPEFLQKFISLADGQRKIEGIWQGISRTYDLRGKRFCLAMAGNPYTESGNVFKIPDMLANRADIYNLGDILSGKEELFALSYLENCLTSNSVLAPLSQRPQSDFYHFVRLAKGEEVASSVFSHSYSTAEVNEIVTILQKLFKIQIILLKINQQYILSAAQDDRYRTEPAFKLQGSYRNMNKLAEKVVAVMNATELENLITDHYQGEAQTLTKGAEENLLKLAELRGILTEKQQQRWLEIKNSYVRLQQVNAGDKDDPVSRVVAQLSGITQQLQQLQQTVTLAAKAARLQANHAVNTTKPQEIEAVNQLAQQINQVTIPLERIQQVLAKSLEIQSINTQQQANFLTQLPKLIPHQEEHKIFLPIAETLQKLVELIENSLLPVVQGYERKSRLDLVLWQRLKDISEILRIVYEDAFNHVREQRTRENKSYSPDSF